MPTHEIKKELRTYFGAHTLQADDENVVVQINSATDVPLTIPSNTDVPFPLSTLINVRCFGAGNVTITPAVGVTVNGTSLELTRYTDGVLQKVDVNEWVFIPSSSTGGANYLVYVAAVSQAGTDAPTAHEFENTMTEGITPGGWGRDNVGRYSLDINNTGDASNVYIPGFGNWDDIGNPYQPILNGSAVVGYYTLIVSGGGGTIVLQTINAAGAFTDLSALMGTGKIYLPEIRVYA